MTVWSAESQDEQGVPVRDAGSVSYSAALESAASRDTDATLSEFAQQADREARRRGFDRAQRRTVLGADAHAACASDLSLRPQQAGYAASPAPPRSSAAPPAPRTDAGR